MLKLENAEMLQTTHEPNIKNVDAYIAAQNYVHLGTNRAILMLVYHCSTDRMQIKLLTFFITCLQSPWD